MMRLTLRTCHISLALLSLCILLLGCLSQPVQAANGRNVALSKNNLLLDPSHGGNGSAWGLERCNSCHVINSIHQQAPASVRELAKNKGYGSCTGCHGTNGSQAERACLICHNDRDLPYSPEVVGIKKHDFDASKHQDLGDKQCVTCHASADMDGQWEDSVDLTRIPDATGTRSPIISQTDFCLRCHNRDHQQPDFRIKNSDPNHPLSASEYDFLNIDVHGIRPGAGNGSYSGLRAGYQYQSIVECSDCHSMHGTHNDQLIIGNSATGVFQIDDKARELRFKVTVKDGDDSQLCVLCHVMNKKIGMAGVNTGNGLAGVHLTGAGINCRECHAHGKGEQDLQVKTNAVSLEKGQLLLTASHGKNANGTAWGIAQCDACHAVSRIHRNAPVIRDIVLRKGYATCMGCHGSNGTINGANVTSNPQAAGLVDPNATRKCLICHNSIDLPASPDLRAAKNHNFKVNTPNALTDQQCISCHENSDMDGQFEANTDLTHFKDRGGRLLDYSNSSEFCLSCHNLNRQQPDFPISLANPRHPLVAMENNWNFIDVHGKRQGSGDRTYAGLRGDVYQYQSVVECVDCHAMHGTHNDKLIIDSSTKGVFKFPDFARNVPFLINTPNGDYSQLCVTCHSMKTIIEQGAENTGNGLTGVHQVGTDCRQCHTHGMAAQTGL